MQVIFLILILTKIIFSDDGIKNISEERLEKLKKDTTYYPFEENGEWGYENALCEELIEPQFQNAGFFNEGLAPVRIGSKYYFINKSNVITIKDSFDFAEIFVNGKARVFDNERIFFIDKEGKKYENLKLYGNEIYLNSIFTKAKFTITSEGIYELIHFKNHNQKKNGRVDIDKRYQMDLLVRPKSKPFDSDRIPIYYGKSFFINELDENVKSKIANDSINLFVDNSMEFLHSEFPNTYNFYIINNTNSDFFFKTYKSDYIKGEYKILFYLQAKDKKGNWVYLTKGYNSKSYICGLFFKMDESSMFLPKNKYLKFNIPVFTGTYKTKLRVAITSSTQTKRENSSFDYFEDVIYYSNEYDGYVNPAQLINLHKLVHPFE